MRTGVRRITNAFLKNQLEESIGEIVFQPRISFKLPPPTDGSLSGLTLDTAVVGEDNTLATMFGIAGNTTTWGVIRKNALSSHNTEPPWIADLETAACSVADGKVPPQTETICLSAEGSFFRPIVARYEKYRSNAKKCYIVFIPSRDRRFSSSLRTSLLLSALILSVRFRQKILPIVADIKAVRPSATPSSKKMELLTKIQKEIVAIETEAVEFGMPTPKDEHDEPVLLNAFRDGEVKDSLRTEIGKWTATRNLMFDKIVAAKDSASTEEATSFLLQEFSDMREMNAKFINVLCEELLYAEKIEQPKE